jgi:hypothetical protein
MRQCNPSSMSRRRVHVVVTSLRRGHNVGVFACSSGRKVCAIAYGFQLPIDCHPLLRLDPPAYM